MIKIGNKDINDFKIGETAVSKVAIGSQTVWEKTSGGNEPIKFSIESGTATVSMTKTGAPNEIYLQYSRDKLSWSDWDLTALEISELSPLYIKGNNQNGISSSGTVCYTFTVSGSGVSCSGNIMSLLGPEVTSIPTSYCFANLFKGSPIVSAPELPATTLQDNCYYSMFFECTALTTAPELPATTLAEQCYNGMFRESGIEKAPMMLISYSDIYSCNNMFFRCRNLYDASGVEIASAIGGSCCSAMFQGCDSLIVPPVLSATSLANNCYANMFYGCTALETAPELPATTLADMCYFCMFYDCTSLTSVKCLASAVSPSNAVTVWLENVSATGTFTKAAGVDWPSGDSGIPEGWTVVEV